MRVHVDDSNSSQMSNVYLAAHVHLQEVENLHFRTAVAPLFLAPSIGLLLTIDVARRLLKLLTELQNQ